MYDVLFGVVANCKALELRVLNIHSGDHASLERSGMGILFFFFFHSGEMEEVYVTRPKRVL